jgi:Berberine and berberine like
VAAPFHCDADDLLFGAGQADGHLTFDGYADRLVQVKRAYDPGNLFHVNRNITP